VLYILRLYLCRRTWCVDFSEVDDLLIISLLLAMIVEAALIVVKIELIGCRVWLVWRVEIFVGFTFDGV